jgi:hypothetical protein
MVLEKEHKEQIIEAVCEAAESMDYGEVRIKIDKTAPMLDVFVETHKRIRLDKNNG